MLIEDGAIVASVPELGLEMALARRGDLPFIDERSVGGAALPGVRRRFAGNLGRGLHLFAILLRDFFEGRASCALHARLLRGGHRRRQSVAAVIAPLPRLALAHPDG